MLTTQNETGVEKSQLREHTSFRSPFHTQLFARSEAGRRNSSSSSGKGLSFCLIERHPKQIHLP